MAGGDYSSALTEPATAEGFSLVRGRRSRFLKPLDKKVKSVTYSADTPDLLLDLNSTASSTVSKTALVQAVKVKNDGYVSALAEFAYNSYTAEGTIDTDASGLRYIKYLLNPGEEITLPTTRAVIGDAVAEWDGTAIDAVTPTTDKYVDVAGSFIDGTGLATGTTATTFNVDDNEGSPAAAVGFYHVGDKIRIENEILEITAIAENSGEEAQLTVIRGVDGSTAATHADSIQLRLPFYNMYHEFDKFSYVQTDSQGRFKCTNFFGYGRSNGTQAGLVPGSIALQFYEPGYQALGLSGVTESSETGLTASTEYGFDITVDGSGLLDSDTLKFTTSATNTKWGGTDGVLSKIQAVFDAQFYTNGSNLLNEKVTVSIENGDVVFRSGQNTSASAILLAAPSAGETTPFGVGRIPAIGNVEVAVAAKLETETTRDPITNGSTYKQIFIRDDGQGNLIWKNQDYVGTINYETGEIDFTVSEKPNAEFAVSVLHTSPFSGKLDPAATGRKNSLIQVLGNTPQKKCEAKLTVTNY